MTATVARAIAGIVGDGPAGRRLGSRCTDLAVAALASSAIFAAGIVLLGETSEGGSLTMGAGPMVATSLVALVVGIAAVASLEPGRRLFTLRLVSAGDQRPACPKRFVREGLAVAPLLVVLALVALQPVAGAVAGAAYLVLRWYTLTRGRHRRVDRLLGTRVVERTA